MYDILVILQEIVIKFSQKLTQTKQIKNIIDFGDIEHYALSILTKKDKDGNTVQTDIAKKYMNKFDEIAIDEYQDSNEVQETILKSISTGKNLFMVGDVKQSIYKFRQARPELFLEKYATYKLKNECNDEESLKIQLFNNFRSKKKILEFVNTIFTNIMSKNLGEIDYTEEEYLNYKANYDSIKQNEKIELNIIEDSKTEDDEELVEEIENQELEAKFVAKKIEEIISSDYKVWDKVNGYRQIKYKDIVILLRSPNSVAPIYEKELANLNIPVFSDTSVKYLESIEIETIMNLLRIIDNPLQDIPLVAVLRSYIGGFTDNELIEIRLVDKNCPFYEVIQKAENPKIDRFMEMINKWKFEQEYLPLDEFIWKIYLDTGYFNYVSLMPNGEFRQANLKMLFEQAKQYENASFKGLYNFIRFIENLKKNSGDLTSAKLIGENEDVVRIMSIHKSKGLEFPLVILSGTGKKFNFQDLKEEILLHQDLGIGPKYINYERKISYDTLAKEALKIKAKNEIISEEMRVLYVGLTRPKEKLIITGISKKQAKDLKKCTSYLDWITLVNSKTDMSGILEVNYYKKTELEKTFEVKEKKEHPSIIKMLENVQNNKEDFEKIDKELTWKYEYMEDTTIDSKTSVSNIAKSSLNVGSDETKDEMNKYQDNVSELITKNKIEFDIPKFMENEKKVSKAEIGTKIHEILQQMDFNKEYAIEEIKEIKEISKEVNPNEIYGFLVSDIAKRARKSEKIYKEQPFYTYIKACDIYDVKSEELVLVQGIIDMYFIEDDEIVLVDYKTDNVKSEQVLIERYEKQLSLYKKALEEATCKKVKEVYIYSTKLNKEILLNLL